MIFIKDHFSNQVPVAKHLASREASWPHPYFPELCSQPTHTYTHPSCRGGHTPFVLESPLYFAAKVPRLGGFEGSWEVPWKPGVTIEKASLELHPIHLHPQARLLDFNSEDSTA